MRIRMRPLLVLPALLSAGFALLSAPASAVTIDWVLVGDPGNAGDSDLNCYAADCGVVDEAYRISKYEVTNAQYAEFLNAKAASDPRSLYNMDMGSNEQGGITRSGSSGSYTYAVKPDFADKPVNFVSFYDALRFTNWLNNGQGSADTETGAYTLLGGTAIPSNGLTVSRNWGTAIVFLPREREWYKAAYYDGLSATYFDFPTGTNAATVCAAPNAAANQANCASAAGGVTSVGAYTGSASPYGTFDQGGNVSEWTETIVGSYLNRLIRGGGWSDNGGYAAAWIWGPLAPANENDNLGFRVASIVPEPGTSLLVMIGLLGLAAPRRR